MKAQGYGSVCCAFLWEGREVCRFGGYKERNEPEGEGEAAGQGMLADRAESMSSGESGKREIGLRD